MLSLNIPAVCRLYSHSWQPFVGPARPRSGWPKGVSIFPHVFLAWQVSLCQTGAVVAGTVMSKPWHVAHRSKWSAAGGPALASLRVSCNPWSQWPMCDQCTSPRHQLQLHSTPTIHHSWISAATRGMLLCSADEWLP
jgi:hypothetical protein